MASYPDIHHLKLKVCCVNTINEINRRLMLGNVLSVGIGVGVWCNIFGPSPASLNTIVSVSQTDYSTLERIVQATAAIRTLSQTVALKMCLNEQLKHHNNYTLNLFWEGMANVFAN
jgi:hypothetical protein